jgi:uncharacterized protein (TIGR01777 family)
MAQALSILVTGGTGFIGSSLCQWLHSQGHKMTILTRQAAKHRTQFTPEIKLIESIDMKQSYDVLINLAGESLTHGRWTQTKKQALLDSRLEVTGNIITYIRETAVKPKLLISGSAIGYYGTSQKQVFTESSEPADQDFAHSICRQWENIALQAEQYGVRVCLLRIGIVLGPNGGALARMLLPFKLGLGGRLGSGEQWFSWIQLEDLQRIIVYLMQHEKISGPINATAPHPVTNAVFTKTLGKVLHRPTILPVPAWQLRLLFGEMADAILLQGQKVIPQRLLDLGFHFEYPQLEAALISIVHG